MALVVAIGFCAKTPTYPIALESCQLLQLLQRQQLTIDFPLFECRIWTTDVRVDTRSPVNSDNTRNSTLPIRKDNCSTLGAASQRWTWTSSLSVSIRCFTPKGMDLTDYSYTFLSILVSVFLHSERSAGGEWSSVSAIVPTCYVT